MEQDIHYELEIDAPLRRGEVRVPTEFPVLVKCALFKRVGYTMVQVDTQFLMVQVTAKGELKLSI